MRDDDRVIPIFHIATRADWQAARAAGEYRVATRGRSLEDVGFVHAARRDQVARVFLRHFRGCGEPLVLLRIDPDRLRSPVVEVTSDGDTWPRIHGPVDVAAVTDVQPLNERGGTAPLMHLFVTEVVRRMVLVAGVLLVAVIGGLLGSSAGSSVGAVGGVTGGVVGGVIGVVAGAAVGVAVVTAISRRPPRSRPAARGR